MIRSAKIFWVLLVSLNLIALMGSSSLLMASPSRSHATHLFSDKGPKLPYNESGCYVCHADGHEQCQGSPLFADDGFLETTHVCDDCHSPDGAFPGGDPLTSLLDPDIGAKANWDEGVYDSGGEMLKSGKGQWCITCHDDVPAKSDWEDSGVEAPDVSLYYTSGHGRSGAAVECLVCHDATFTHIDHDARTYAFTNEDVDPADGIPDIYVFGNSGVAYAAGYRLRYVNGEVPIMVPTNASYTFGAPAEGLTKSTAYRRCFDSGCHDSYRVFGWDSLQSGITSYTNFRSSPPDPPRSYGGGGENTNFHERHRMYGSWDSDWDFDTDTYPDYTYGYDSMFTCSSCHNVHGAAGIYGSTNEPMIRDGSLAGRGGYGFSYVIEDPDDGYPWVTSDGATRANSVGAVFRNCTIDMCGGCHAGMEYSPSGAKYYAASRITIYNDVHTGSTSDTTLKVDDTPWIEGELVGKLVRNLTDEMYVGYGSTIIANTSNTATVERLYDGSDNLWEPGDQAEIFENTQQYYIEYYRASQDCSSSVDMVWTYDSDGAGSLPGGGDPDYSSLSVWEEDTRVDITTANDVMVLAHSGLTGAIASGDTVAGANSGATGLVVGVATNTQICIDVTSGQFQSGEQIYKDQENYVESSSPPAHIGVMYLDCYDGPHVDRVTLAGATTDSLHYRCIHSASDCDTPFAGKRETGAYFEWNENNHLFKLSENCARVEHVGATLNYTSDADTKVVFNMLGDYAKAIGCIAYDSFNSGTHSVNGFALNGNNTIAANCIAHDIEGNGFVLYGLSYLNYYFAYNCTAIDNGGQGFKQSYTSGETYVWNCVASNNAGGDFSSTVDQYNYEYNMSSDGTAPGDRDKINKDFTNMWVNETSGLEDYHLSETGMLDSDFQGGVNPEMFYPYTRYTLTDDIDGEPRSIWYRGSDEAGPPGHDYAFSTISGSVGTLDGVTMNGLPGNPVTSLGGFYSAVAGPGWSGTVTPAKEGYTFDPVSRVYSGVTSDQTNQNYTPIGNTFTISGSVGIDGVTMSGLPGNPVTSGGGLYSATVHQEEYVHVTPTKAGYRFDPKYRQYYGVTSDQTNQDYTPTMTHIISGTVGALGQVEIRGIDAYTDVYTNADGFYSATVDDGWSGTVYTEKVGYTFAPESRTYSNVTSDVTGQDYTPTETSYVISGSVGTLDGVIMDGLPGDPVTSGGGLYSAVVGYGWGAYVTPLKVGYNFTPEDRHYWNTSSDKTNQDFTPSVNSYTISGSVGTLDGVTMSGLPGDPVTSGGGFYSATVDWGWSGTVTPTKDSYTVNPVSQDYSYVTYDQTNQDYTPTPIATYTVTFGDNSGDDFPGTVEDALIWERTGEVNFNYGGKLTNPVGERGTVEKERRSLIRFKDIASNIGSGKVITSATMYLWCSGEETSTDYGVSAYRVLKNWVEGNSNGAEETGAACWNDAQYTSVAWNTPGCSAASDVTGEDSTADRRATAEDSTTITQTGQYFSWDLTTAVQNWYSGGWKEYGFILVNDSDGIASTRKIFSSSEGTTDGQRPYLEVTYQDAAP